MHKRPKKRTIGRRELVDFPELELFEIEAKIDTGAYTSALHCTDIREVKLEDGSIVIRCRFMDEDHPHYNNKVFEFREFALRDIKNSFGDVQQRYVIKTAIQVFDKIIQAEFSLSDRSDMRYPVLIGRVLLNRHFIVDVSRKNVAYKRRLKLEQKKREAGLS
ncbi:ATP-dependent zinc protease [Adhaeribacter sp. BT258]|uniref:ATP-dependent zinc protease n=1 Tax=Adhaeribacter terrigena TaxID=2793070 RepID=A0ABS1C3T6_9BACT|nr:RimK/LysX family protein [Adhaeribacter terrigena]MBK0404053.1 ATP-dependent zinc protease [Adhaeribacter terrigena]